MGCYHGKFSFDQLSHLRGCLIKKLKMEGVNNMRYPPHTPKKLGWARFFILKTFDLSWVGRMLLLALMAVVAACVLQVRETQAKSKKMLIFLFVCVISCLQLKFSLNILRQTGPFFPTMYFIGIYVIEQHKTVHDCKVAAIVVKQQIWKVSFISPVQQITLRSLLIHKIRVNLCVIQSSFFVKVNRRKLITI